MELHLNNREIAKQLEQTYRSELKGNSEHGAFFKQAFYWRDMIEEEIMELDVTDESYEALDEDIYSIEHVIYQTVFETDMEGECPFVKNIDFNKFMNREQILDYLRGYTEKLP